MRLGKALGMLATAALLLATAACSNQPDVLQPTTPDGKPTPAGDVARTGTQGNVHVIGAIDVDLEQPIICSEAEESLPAHCVGESLVVEGLTDEEITELARHPFEFSLRGEVESGVLFVREVVWPASDSSPFRRS